MSAKLFIICGHGAGDPGACAGGETEADLVRQLAKRIKARGGSAVQVGDTSVNWYKSDCISKGKCPKGVPVVELHMDSAAASAKGGHVIIKAGYAADEYDKALEKFIKGFFPGRSVTLSKRTDLANPNRAAKMGVNYRLVENGFISNAGDRKKFIDKMDDLADGYLAAFGIKSNGASSGSSSTRKPPAGRLDPGETILLYDNDFGPVCAKYWQARLRKAGYYPASKYKIDGDFAYYTKLETQKFLQQKTSHYPKGKYKLDGDFAEHSIKALQSYLKDLKVYWDQGGWCLIDGDWGEWTTLAVQRAVNAGVLFGDFELRL